MRGRLYFVDLGRDLKDTKSDDELLAIALSEPNRIFDDYYRSDYNEDWGAEEIKLFPGVTNHRVKQRKQRVFLLICLFAPRSEKEADCRERALLRFAPDDQGPPPAFHVEVTITPTKRGRAR